MTNTTLQKLTLNYILKEATINEFNNIPDSIFNDLDINYVYKLIKNWCVRYSTIPSINQIKTLVLEDTKEDKPSIALVETIFDVDLNSYDEVWLKHSVEGTIQWKKFYEKLINTISYIKKIGVVDPTKAMEHIEKCSNILNTGDLHIFDNDTDLGSSFYDIEKHFKKDEDFITTNHLWVDNRMGGYSTGTLHVYCGFANVGKSIFLCNDAAKYLRGGYDVLYVSAEMNESSVMQRIGANVLDVDINLYRDHNSLSKIRKKLEDFMNSTLIPLGDLYVKQFPTSVATVADIERYYLKMIDRGVKPKVIVIDYINILAPESKALADNLYLKIKSIAEQLRAFAIKYGVVIITATQLNRSGDEVSDITLSSIAESAGLIHTSDTMYGIIQTQEMKLNNEYWLKILRIREGSGKNHRCLYTIDYPKMRLYETNDVQEYEM